MRFINLLILISAVASWASELPLLSTKQELSNIRYLSSDGRITYFQQRSGELLLSKNYQILSLLKGKEHSQFLVSGTLEKTSVGVEMDESFHSDINVLKSNRLFIGKYGENKLKEIGRGVNLQLHGKDLWVSYFVPREAVIKIIYIPTFEVRAQIKITHRLTPYFIPEVVMINDETIVFSDINNQGFAGLIEYKINTKKMTPLFKSSLTGTRLQICTIQSKLIIGEFTLRETNRGSQIHVMDTYNFPKYSTSYSSDLNDPGNLVCDEKLAYFIKTIDEDKIMQNKTTEVASFNPTNNEVKVISDLRKVSQVIKVEDRILIPFREQFYVVTGSSDIKVDSFIKQSQQNDKKALEEE